MELQVIEQVDVNPDAKVRVKEMGNVTEVMYSNSYSSKCSIEKLNKYEYVEIETGEVKMFNRKENRGQDLSSVRKSLSRLRDYINTNVVDVNNCKWVTLTYAENMIDPKKLYRDFDNFNRRLRKEIGHYEYIVAREPQGRGAWHCHVVIIFAGKAPWIHNDVIWKAWSPKGFKKGIDYTKTQKLDDVDNVGAYLTAYMGDMELTDVVEHTDVLNMRDGFQTKEIDGKRYVKGARLYLYPPQFNLYSCSRGIKKPVIYYDIEKNAQKKVSAATLTYLKSIQLTDSETNFNKIIDYRYYNSKRKK